MPQLSQSSKKATKVPPYVYKITGNGLTYYGASGNSFKKRKAEHIYSQATTSKLIINSTNDWKMEVIEHGFDTLDEAKRWETWYILNNPCVNKHIEKSRYVEPVFSGPKYVQQRSSKIPDCDLEVLKNSFGSTFFRYAHKKY